MKKRPILLLELVISLVLFGAIVGILFSSYRELSLAKVQIRKDKEWVLSRQKLQLRLAQIFSNVKTMKMADSSCLMTYDNGVDVQTEFRGILEGMLFIDKGRLALVSWPEKGIGRKEILLEPASYFSFEFFDSKKGTWAATYPEQKPFMMKMTIDNIPYPFFL
ncbi:MAG TPA: DUF1494 domain-containing protein [Rhabdochlamydiaceae bacterium]|nr:DUF1494 domain-containing protein [Rhabdochlamydiaceae bacterium]